MDLCGSPGFCMLATPATTVVYCSRPSAEPIFRLLLASSSPVVPWISGPSSKRFPGAGRLLAGSDVQSEFESSSAFCTRCNALSQGMSEPCHQLRRDVRGPKCSRRSGRKGLLCSRFRLPQFSQECRGNLRASHSRNKG